MHEAHHLEVDDFLCLNRGFLPGRLIVGDHFMQIVNGIKEYVFQLVDLGFDVTRYCKVNQKHGPVAALTQSGLHRAFAQNRQSACGGRHNDVCLVKAFRYLCQRDGFAAQLLRQGLRPLDGAIGHNNVTNLILFEMTRNELDGFPRTDQEHGLFIQTRENALGEIDSRERHRDRTRTNGGVSPNLFCYREGMLKQSVQDLAGGSSLMRDRKSRLHLPQNLRFAEHH